MPISSPAHYLDLSPTSQKKMQKAWFDATHQDDIDTVKSFLFRGFPIDNHESDYRQTGLIKSMINGSNQVFNYLVSRADLTQTDEDGWTPLIYASYGNQKAYLQSILSYCLFDGVCLTMGQNALMYAVEERSHDVLPLLLAHTPHLDLTNLNGDSVIDLAEKGGNQAIIKLVHQFKHSRDEQAELLLTVPSPPATHMLSSAPFKRRL